MKKLGLESVVKKMNIWTVLGRVVHSQIIPSVHLWFPFNDDLTGLRIPRLIFWGMEVGDELAPVLTVLGTLDKLINIG